MSVDFERIKKRAIDIGLELKPFDDFLFILSFKNEPLVFFNDTEYANKHLDTLESYIKFIKDGGLDE